jgi:tRNA(fMet)-specific endonuclease VapC
VMPTTVLVDTDVFSYLWQSHPESDRFRPIVEGATLALSFTTVAELWYGAVKRRWGEQRRNELRAGMRPYAVLPYSRDLSYGWGELRAALEGAGQPLADNDLWIATTALHYDIPLATNNVRHFERVPGLRLAS